jgi:integrase
MEGLNAPSVPKKDMQVFTVAKAKEFLETCRSATLQRWDDADRLKWTTFFAVALYTGMRVSELRGLRWQGVNFEARELRVRQNALRIPKVGWLRKSTKNAGSVRPTSADATVLDMLAPPVRGGDIEGPQPENCRIRPGLPLGSRYPLEDRRIHYVFHRLCDLAEVKRIRPYDLYHCCATLLLAAGVNPKVVQERLGHASVALTLRIYSHVLPTIQKDAAQTLGKLLA